MLPAIIRALSALTNKLQQSLEPKHIERREIEPLLQSIPKDATILEVGGGYRPRFMKSAYPNAYHFDHGDAQALRTKYANDPTVAHLIGNIQAIDFVSSGEPIETLVTAGLKFDLIYGSHVLEHQVDLIGHLQSLEKLLKPGGRVIEIIPDLRTCFDALRYPSVSSDVIQVHLRPSLVHRGRQVFDFESRLINKNIGRRMVEGDFDDAQFRCSLRDAYEAMLAAEAPGHPYRDTHAWTFTPETFRLLMLELRLLGLVQLTPVYVSPQYGTQFCAVLMRGETSIEAMTASEVESLERERRALAIQVRF